MSDLTTRDEIANALENLKRLKISQRDGMTYVWASRKDGSLFAGTATCFEEALTQAVAFGKGANG